VQGFGGLAGSGGGAAESGGGGGLLGRGGDGGAVMPEGQELACDEDWCRILSVT
jgi:hypothetical protein